MAGASGQDGSAARSLEKSHKGSGRLLNRKALITGGDSGMGRAAAIAYAREGADVAINYLPDEEPDAREVEELIRAAGRREGTAVGFASLSAVSTRRGEKADLSTPRLGRSGRDDEALGCFAALVEMMKRCAGSALWSIRVMRRPYSCRGVREGVWGPSGRDAATVARRRPSRASQDGARSGGYQWKWSA